MEDERADDPRHQALRATASALGPAAGLLAVLYVLLAVVRFLQYPADVAVAISGTAAGAAIVLAGLWWRQCTNPLPVTWSPHVAGAIGAVAAVAAVVNLRLTGDPLQSTSIMLIVIGVGALVEHRGWAAGVVCVNLGVWAWTATVFPAEEWGDFGVALMSSCLLAMVLRAVFHASKNSLEGARQEASERAISDELTGLLNRRGLEVVGEQALATARRLHESIAVLFIDLDGMKAINDTQGHLAGDAWLAETARRLTQVFRDADAVARVGGDEFAVLQVGVAREDLVMLRDRASSALEHASVGVASADHPASTSLVELMHRADQEMYRDKQSRRDRSAPRSTGR